MAEENDSIHSNATAEERTIAEKTVEPRSSEPTSPNKQEANGYSTTDTDDEMPETRIIAAASKDAYPKDTSEKALQDIATAESQEEKLPYPKSVFFIISNEFCERFNYYGMRTILVLYLSRQLNYTDDAATVVFHIFTMFVYFLCILGAIISDSWLGKFKTILYLSLVYVCGSILITLGAIPTLDLPGTTFTMLGLSLIALGSGGIKPCVSAFGGDQFKLPAQVKQMTTFFSLFYFSINAGSLISTSVTPILREDVHCFGENECYSLAFGVPAVLMAVSIIIFVLGRPLYISKPPAGNMVLLVSKTIGNAIATKWREKKTNPRDHWLDYADKKYDKQLVADVKVLMRVLVLYLPLPVFWALFDQQGSRWTFQATRMNGDMGSWDIKPDQVQVLNPLLILIFIPLYDVAFYPALRLIRISRPLQKLTLGGILAGVAFLISAFVELSLEKTYPVLPSSHLAQLRVFNAESCNYTFNTNIAGLESFKVPAMGSYVNKFVPVPSHSIDIQYKITTTEAGCASFPSGSYNLPEATARSLFMNTRNFPDSLKWYEDFAGKPSKGKPLARTLANVAPQSIIKWVNKNGKVDLEQPASKLDTTELNTGRYTIHVNNNPAGEVLLEIGGVYTVIVNETPQGYEIENVAVTEPNSVSILWLIPQYVVLTLGEVMFSVTGLEFSYSQAPLTMKSVLQACWLLTVAFGNVIVVIIAELKLFESQANEFFLFAGLMFVDMIVFMWLAYRYVPNNPSIVATESDPKYEIKPLNKGVENKTLELNE